MMAARLGSTNVAQATAQTHTVCPGVYAMMCLGTRSKKKSHACLDRQQPLKHVSPVREIHRHHFSHREPIVSPALVEPVVNQEAVILLHMLAVLLQESCWIWLHSRCTEAYALRHQRSLEHAASTLGCNCSES